MTCPATTMTPSADIRRASLWKPLSQQRVHCRLCSHYCIVPEGRSGRCGVRHNKGGTLYTLVHDRVAALHVDPVEKKPLFHYLPGTATLSLGTVGCNFTCGFCQNWSLSTAAHDDGVSSPTTVTYVPPRSIPGHQVTPQVLVEEAVSCGAASIAFTYSEPTVFYELMAGTADLALASGLGTIMVSNGYQSRRCLEALRPRIKAANIDLKAFSDRFYRDVCGARLAPVLDNLKRMVGFGWWVEVTTLVIPGLNDSDDELAAIARFIHDELGAHVPWHISRFHPAHELGHLPPTPLETLERAWKIGRASGLHFVYLGNLPGHTSESTFCPGCGTLFAERFGYRTQLPNGPECPRCGAHIPGVGWGHTTRKGHAPHLYR
ncbi:AmmeMemoRadiSam system radical SAM enzyme [Nitratidesulfovibrio vulgaris]|nr:AmmeMemoRadiSam system radical SAM enzyme [Nitratidesulfovibrio vulgaris]ADP87032.1 Radical SAM domain protein [Nitratidesulfovibrio vulgaris RCH1]